MANRRRVVPNAPTQLELMFGRVPKHEEVARYKINHEPLFEAQRAALNKREKDLFRRLKIVMDSKRGLNKTQLPNNIKNLYDLPIMIRDARTPELKAEYQKEYDSLRAEVLRVQNARKRKIIRKTRPDSLNESGRLVEELGLKATEERIARELDKVYAKRKALDEPLLTTLVGKLTPDEEARVIANERAKNRARRQK
ncbi:MAG: hypothetical protein WCW13_01695 [archaeon]|jgi:hypothetical protein